MPPSNSVLRRYTPPTCTLQIVARNSSLSRWTGRAVTKALQFDLRFDDPRLPEEKQVNIQGTRDQLEDLHEAVTIYTQRLLNQSPDRFNAILSALAPPAADGVVSSTPRELNLISNDSQALSEESSSLSFSDASAHHDPTAIPSTGLFRKIFLQPGRGLSHKLFLGSLATEETGAVIQLSLLQLFDLVTALDEYAADVLILPNLNHPRSAAAPPAWASIAAILLLAVGLTAVVQHINRSNPQQQTANRNTTQDSSGNQRPVALQPPPLAPLPMPTPLYSPVPSVPPLSSLPSPSAIPSVSIPETIPDLKAPPGLSAPQTIPVNPIPSTTIAPPIFINPTPSQNNIDSATTRSPQFQITSPERDLQAALSSKPRGSAPVAESSGNPLATSTLQGTGNQNTSNERERQGSTQTPLPSTSITPNASKATAFDTIPQVAQVREYFKQRWQPPSGLTTTLEYSVVLDVDGTIQKIIPLGQASINYIERSGMPQIGKRFVSPNKIGQTPRIRVVLFSDGKVQTFLESAS